RLHLGAPRPRPRHHRRRGLAALCRRPRRCPLAARGRLPAARHHGARASAPRAARRRRVGRRGRRLSAAVLLRAVVPARGVRQDDGRGAAGAVAQGSRVSGVPRAGCCER
ncbi:hypothetical protein BN1708_019885, partial [Verticillium longisporum]